MYHKFVINASLNCYCNITLLTKKLTFTCIIYVTLGFYFLDKIHKYHGLEGMTFVPDIINAETITIFTKKIIMDKQIYKSAQGS